MVFQIRVAVGRGGEAQQRDPVAERQALAFPRPVGERTQHVGGGLALAVLLEEIDDLGMAQPALLPPDTRWSG